MEHVGGLVTGPNLDDQRPGAKLTILILEHSEFVRLLSKQPDFAAKLHQLTQLFL